MAMLRLGAREFAEHEQVVMAIVEQSADPSDGSDRAELSAVAAALAAGARHRLPGPGRRRGAESLRTAGRRGARRPPGRGPRGGDRGRRRSPRRPARPVPTWSATPAAGPAPSWPRIAARHGAGLLCAPGAARDGGRPRRAAGRRPGVPRQRPGRRQPGTRSDGARRRPGRRRVAGAGLAVHRGPRRARRWPPSAVTAWPRGPRAAGAGRGGGPADPRHGGLHRRPPAPRRGGPRPRLTPPGGGQTSLVTSAIASSTSSVRWKSSRSARDALPSAISVLRIQSTSPPQ